MRRFNTTIISVLILLFSMALYAEKPSVGANLTVQSRFVVNGIDYSSGPVFQPDMWISWGDLTLITWFNIDLTDTLGNRGDINEVDLVLDYGYEFKHVNLGLGLASYSYPLDGGRNGEAYLKLGSNFKVANISLTAKYDIWRTKLYFMPKVSAEYTIADMFTPNISASIGIGGENYHMSAYKFIPDNKLNDLSTSLEVAVTPSGKIGDILSASASLKYATIINSEVADYVESEDGMNQDKGKLSFSFTLSAGF